MQKNLKYKHLLLVSANKSVTPFKRKASALTSADASFTIYSFADQKTKNDLTKNIKPAAHFSIWFRYIYEY